MPINTYPDSSSSSSSGSTKSGSGSSGGGGGGGTANDPYAAAVRAQNRKERRAQHKAARRALQDAATIGRQAASLKAALGSEGFIKALNTGLANIARVQAQTDATLMQGYQSRLGSLDNAAADNEKAGAGQTVANLSNRGRERANALSEVAAQGAGESDALRAQQMSLRNWNANQSEVNRNFYDTLTSVNSSLHDLNADTKTARINNALQAEADRGQAYAGYYDQMSQTQTQLGNLYGQQAADYSAALEQVGNKRTRRRLKRAQNQSSSAYDAAAGYAGQAYSSPGASAELQAWTGAEDFDGYVNPGTVLNASSSSTDLAKPEGATLRRFE